VWYGYIIFVIDMTTTKHGTRFSLLITALLLLSALLWYRHSVQSTVRRSGHGSTGAPPAEMTSQNNDANPENEADPYHTPLLVIPDGGLDHVVLTQPGFTVGYCTLHLQPVWVAYQLTANKVGGPHPRKNNFYTDPSLQGRSAKRSDYHKSGFDRGHLAPAADMAWSERAMYASFYFTNVSPQMPGFNRGIWKTLEKQVRDWALDYDTVYVVTGPVLREGLSTIDNSDVSVPQHFYKVILRNLYTRPEGIAFLIEADATGVISSYAITIDSLERFTDIDFFPLIPQAVLRRTEERLCLPCWNLGGRSRVGLE
jgi:endonuclease G, mitochondrial